MCRNSHPIHNPRLHNIVKRCMKHSPCDSIRRKAPCMRDGKCTTKFPKTFAETTNIVFAENAVLEDVLSRQRHSTKSKICE